jgi:hypothetical protein
LSKQAIKIGGRCKLGKDVKFYAPKTILQLENWPSSAGGAIFHRPVGRKIEPVHIICQFILWERERKRKADLILSPSRFVGQKWLRPAPDSGPTMYKTLSGYYIIDCASGAKSRCRRNLLLLRPQRTAANNSKLLKLLEWENNPTLYPANNHKGPGEAQRLPENAAMERI